MALDSVRYVFATQALARFVRFQRHALLSQRNVRVLVR